MYSRYFSSTVWKGFQVSGYVLFLLCPFASICINEFPGASENPYMLYTMSINGVLRLIHLNNVTDYRPGSVCDVEELNIHSFHVRGTITSIAATAGFVVIGKHDGWVGCFRLGSLESASQGFMYQLQEAPINFIVHFFEKMSRPTAAPVKDLLCLEIGGKKVAFVRFLHKMLEGARFVRLWAGDINRGVLPLAILHQPTQNDTEQQQQQQQQQPIPPEQGMGEVVKLQDTISIYRCHISRTWRSCFLVEPSVKSISKEKNSIIDVKLSLNEIWILRRDVVVLHNLSDLTESGECNFFGSLEPVVAEQLFENSEHAGTDLFWLINSVFPFAMEEIFNRVSSIFMRMLVLPGIYHKSVLRATFRDFKKHITDSKLQSLDPSGIREEIISILEHEV
nr:hypothetical protein [Tanacetum cinerariifolium]